MIDRFLRLQLIVCTEGKIIYVNPFVVGSVACFDLVYISNIDEPQSYRARQLLRPL